MSFERIVGNREAVGRLRRMVAERRLPSSLLFSGAPGVGKLEAALALAKALNCPQAAPGADDASDACPACQRIERGEHPDVRIVRPEGKGLQIKVEAIREIVKAVPFRPFEGKKRVFILNDADAMNPSAANALLKSLEEPPPSSMLILVTAHEADLLPTLRSRCQTVRFAPLAPEEVESVLVGAHGLPPADARLAAAAAGGNLARALAAPVEALTTQRRQALDLIEALAAGMDYAELLAAADALTKDGDGLPGLLRLALGLSRDVVALSTGSSAFLLHTDLREPLEGLARRAPLDFWIDAYVRLEQSLRALDQYANKRLTMETLLFDLNRAGAPA